MTPCIYVLHFDQPLGNLNNPRAQAQHYLGWAMDLTARLAEHAAGRGAAITRAAVERGISWRAFVCVQATTRWRKHSRPKRIRRGCARSAVSAIGLADCTRRCRWLTNWRLTLTMTRLPRCRCRPIAPWTAMSIWYVVPGVPALFPRCHSLTRAGAIFPTNAGARMIRRLFEKLPCPRCGWNLWKGRCLNPFCS